MLRACPTMSVALVFAIAALTAASGFFVVAPSFYTNSRLTRGLRQWPPDSGSSSSSVFTETPTSYVSPPPPPPPFLIPGLSPQKHEAWPVLKTSV